MMTEPYVAWDLKSVNCLNVALEPGWVLHRRAYGDGSFIVDCFGLHLGRFSAVIRGAGRKSRGGSAVGQAQPFTPLLLKTAGRGDLKTLHQLETTAAAVKLEGKALFKGLYINELLIRTLPRYDPHPRLFAVYGDLLPKLIGDDEQPLREFELTLLEELGYELIFAHDAEGDYIDPQCDYGYQPSVGFIRKMFQDRQQAGPVDTHVLKVSGEALLAIATWRHGDYVLSDSESQCLKRIIRLALAQQLGERPLKSRELFRAFMRDNAQLEGANSRQ